MCCHTISDVTISPQYSHFLCFYCIYHNWKYPLVTTNIPCDHEDMFRTPPMCVCVCVCVCVIFNVTQRATLSALLARDPT